MNTEDEIQFEGRDGWRTFDVVYSQRTGDEGMNQWSAWQHEGSVSKWVATAYTRNEVIEKAKMVLNTA